MINETTIRVSPEVLLNALGVTSVSVSITGVHLETSADGYQTILLRLEGRDVPPNAPECRVIVTRIESHLRPVR